MCHLTFKNVPWLKWVVCKICWKAGGQESLGILWSESNNVVCSESEQCGSSSKPVRSAQCSRIFIWAQLMAILITSHATKSWSWSRDNKQHCCEKGFWVSNVGHFSSKTDLKRQTIPPGCKVFQKPVPSSTPAICQCPTPSAFNNWFLIRKNKCSSNHTGNVNFDRLWQVSCHWRLQLSSQEKQMEWAIGMEGTELAAIMLVRRNSQQWLSPLFFLPSWHIAVCGQWHDICLILKQLKVRRTFSRSAQSSSPLSIEQVRPNRHQLSQSVLFQLCFRCTLFVDGGTTVGWRRMVKLKWEKQVLPLLPARPSIASLACGAMWHVSLHCVQHSQHTSMSKCASPALIWLKCRIYCAVFCCCRSQRIDISNSNDTTYVHIRYAVRHIDNWILRNSYVTDDAILRSFACIITPDSNTIPTYM